MKTGLLYSDEDTDIKKTGLLHSDKDTDIKKTGLLHSDKDTDNFFSSFRLTNFYLLCSFSTLSCMLMRQNVINRHY
mgnify:CR=1 FL=1